LVLFGSHSATIVAEFTEALADNTKQLTDNVLKVTSNVIGIGNSALDLANIAADATVISAELKKNIYRQKSISALAAKKAEVAIEVGLYNTKRASAKANSNIYIAHREQSVLNIKQNIINKDKRMSTIKDNLIEKISLYSDMTIESPDIINNSDITDLFQTLDSILINDLTISGNSIIYLKLIWANLY